MNPSEVASCIIAIVSVVGLGIICLTAHEIVKVLVHREQPIRKVDLQALQDGQSELFARWDALRGQSFAPLEKLNEIREDVSALRHEMLKRTDSLDERTDKNERGVVRTVEEFKALQHSWLEEKNRLASSIMSQRRGA